MNHKSFGKHITGIYRHLQIIINHDLNPFGLGSGQYVFLGTLAQNEGISQKELSAIIKIDKTTTAKALKKLESEGYIFRQQDLDDKRYNRLYLTDKGTEFIPIMRKKLARTTEILTKNMNDDQKDLAYEMLETMMSNAIDAVEDIREQEKKE